MRLVGPGGAYRCHFVQHNGDQIEVSSPIQADRFVPIRVGEKLLVQVPSEDCMLSFSTVVVSRDSDKHQLVLKAPTTLRRIERRSERRSERLFGEDVLFDGEMASLVDLSAAGACVVTRKRPNSGSRVRIVLPQSGLDAFGWALESSQAAFGIHQGYKVRVQFEEPLAGLDRQKA
jgi:c-di-GMP-binding flagellar brake protein YcgR